MQRVYLDYNATTPLDPLVADSMNELLRQSIGNASSLHWFGQRARAVVEEAREQVARLLGCSSGEIVFTASGTEADNMALWGVVRAVRAPRRKIVVSAIEHHAVLKCARSLAEEGRPMATFRVGADGVADLENLQRRLDNESVAVMALMLANNETGVVQPVAEAARMARERGAIVLCDAVQAVGKIPVDVAALGVDLLALSGHKMYGPLGVGALYVRRGTPLRALLLGGGQERERRAGTENVVGIAGLGRAATLAGARLAEDALRVAPLRDLLETRLLAIPGAARNGSGARVSNTTNVAFEGVDAESLVMALDLAGIAVSTGAACSAGAVAPSHVLRAMGLPAARVEASVRFSLGRHTTREEIELTANAVAQAIEQQRKRGRQDRRWPATL